MLRRTIYIEEATAGTLERLAADSGRSQSELIREALRRYVTERRGAGDHTGLPVGVGRYESGRSDISAQARELLRSPDRRTRSRP